MSSDAAMENASFAGATLRYAAARETLAVVVLMYALTQSSEALAGDSSASVVKDIQPIVGGTPLSLAFVPREAPREPQFSATQFGQRQPVMDAPASIAAQSAYQAEPLQATSAWQRLADYRSQGRVQLLTLWESRRSTVSLQAGKHGGPSLQWSSRLMNRGGATRGLLDRFASKLTARSASPGTVPKTINLLQPAKPQ